MPRIMYALTIIIASSVAGVFSCGTPYYEPELSSTRIVGGKEAVKHSWPWMVTLRQSGTHVCAGIIIDPQFVLTAAHCVLSIGDIRLWTVIAGRHNNSPGTNEATEQDVAISQIKIHESFDTIRNDNDIALIKLSTPLAPNKYVQPVCLPPQGDDPKSTAVMYLSGWGDTRDEYDFNLKQAQLPIIDRDRCNSDESYNGAVSTSMFCAGYLEGGDSHCQGDDGGPLVAQHGSGHWVVHGVVSWIGGNCGDRNYPGVYSRVGSFVNWIYDMMMAM